MDITVLVEPVAGSGFRAVSGAPFAMQADAPTREEAIGKIRELIADRLGDGAELLNLQVGSPEHPLARFVGILKGDPLLEPWKAAMEDYREAHDQQPDAS